VVVVLVLAVGAAAVEVAELVHIEQAPLQLEPTQYQQLFKLVLAVIEIEMEATPEIRAPHRILDHPLLLLVGVMVVLELEDLVVLVVVLVIVVHHILVDLHLEIHSLEL
jgi:hypothetical protein